MKLVGVSKRFQNGVVAVDNVDLEVGRGSLLALVGPSGCGKTTLLRMIAGLEHTTGGHIEIGGREVTGMAPRDRDVAMVFQNYALYPHMTVRDNIGFSLRVRHVPRNEIALRVERAARMLELTELLERRPGQLSGGQRQRVAMGRAIVRNASVCLLDEPLSNLDAQLRASTRDEILRVQREIGSTMILVTHDQLEALSMGDAVGVMRGGVLEQLAHPAELYERPANLFVAAFIGTPTINLLACRLSEYRDSVALGEHRLALVERLESGGTAAVVVGLRPEDIELIPAIEGVRDHNNLLKGVVLSCASIGADAHAVIEVKAAGFSGDALISGESYPAVSAGLAQSMPLHSGSEASPVTRIVVRTSRGVRLERGARVGLHIPASAIHVFDAETGLRVS